MNPISLSYAHEDAESAREIYPLLIGNPLLVWMDEKDLLPGQDWKLAIESAINQCDIFIACLSKTSVTKKGFVQKELRTAYDVLDNLPEEYEKWYGKWVTKLHNSYNKIMADIALDHEFDQTLTTRCDNLKNQGLDVSQLQEEIKQNQGVFAVKRLFFRNKGLELLAKLKEKNLLGQSMEALVVQRHFQPLFTKDEVAKAHKRLEEAGFFKQQ
jgi:hypothetical protein